MLAGRGLVARCGLGSVFTLLAEPHSAPSVWGVRQPSAPRQTGDFLSRGSLFTPRRPRRQAVSVESFRARPRSALAGWGGAGVQASVRERRA